MAKKNGRPPEMEEWTVAGVIIMQKHRKTLNKSGFSVSFIAYNSDHAKGEVRRYIAKICENKLHEIGSVQAGEISFKGVCLISKSCRYAVVLRFNNESALLINCIHIAFTDYPAIGESI